jgi:hypothetical protein
MSRDCPNTALVQQSRDRTKSNKKAGGNKFRRCVISNRIDRVDSAFTSRYRQRTSFNSLATDPGLSNSFQIVSNPKIVLADFPFLG